MAKQKEAPARRLSKTPSDRSKPAKAAKPVKPSTAKAKPDGRPAAKKKAAAEPAPKSTVKAKPVESKPQSKTAPTKPLPKPAAKGLAKAPISKAAPVKASPPAAKAALKPATRPAREKANGPAVQASGAKTKPTAPPKPAPAARGKAVKPSPTVSHNGQVAGVLQAARSVASKTNKIVELPKERKSHLTAEELAEFKQILLDKRRELVEDMVNLEGESKRSGGESGAAAGTMPIHMADLGSDTWEQEFTLNLIEKTRGIVREIDEALDRIEKKTYGTCLATGRPISKARLRVKPWAKYCIEYARKRELGMS